MHKCGGPLGAPSFHPAPSRLSSEVHHVLDAEPCFCAPHAAARRVSLDLALHPDVRQAVLSRARARGSEWKAAGRGDTLEHACSTTRLQVHLPSSALVPLKKMLASLELRFAAWSEVSRLDAPAALSGAPPAAAVVAAAPPRAVPAGGVGAADAAVPRLHSQARTSAITGVSLIDPALTD